MKFNQSAKMNQSDELDASCAGLQRSSKPKSPTNAANAKLNILFMNQYLRKYLGTDYTLDVPKKHFEVKNIVQYVFQTKQHMENKRKNNRLKTSND